MASPTKNFVEHKVSLALGLADGQLGGTYGDAILILASTISALAQDTWPGRGIDKVRFVELWHTYAQAHLRPSLVSLPLLCDDLERSGDATALAALRATGVWSEPGFGSLVVTSAIDRSDTDVAGLCPTIPAKRIRKYSYPSLFYEFVRSAYVHEYRIGSAAAVHEQAGPGSRVSYVNNIRPPYRRIHFPVSWVADIARGLAASMRDVAPEAPPARWWLDG